MRNFAFSMIAQCRGKPGPQPLPTLGQPRQEDDQGTLCSSVNHSRGAYVLVSISYAGEHKW